MGISRYELFHPSRFEDESANTEIVSSPTNKDFMNRKVAY